MRQIKHNKGVFTVELTLIFPVIFLAILAVLYMSIIHYQNMITSAVAMQSANRIAAYWQYIGDESTEMLDGTRSGSAAQLLIESDFKHRDPYRNIIDGNKGNRTRAGQVYANSLIGGLPSFYSDGSDAQIQVKKAGCFLMPYIEVTTERQFINPLGRSFEQFGIGDREQRKVRATAPLTSNAEFVRNIDFMQEVIEDMREK